MVECDMQPKDKEKWSGVDLQKLGIIGVLIFFSQFLMDFITEDRAGVSEEIRQLNSKVNTVIVKQEIIQQTLNNSGNMTARDFQDIRKQVESLDDEREKTNQQLQVLRTEINNLKNGN